MTNEIKSFFLICSGANREILARPECAIETNKYIGIGATVFFTAVLAVISSSYALYRVFGSVTVAVIFGFLWGVIILNLDRYIVSTMKKEYVPSYLPAQDSRRMKWAEIRRALPRLLLAVFISIIITKPLELKLFEDEIHAQVVKTNSAEVARIKDLVKSEFTEIDVLNNENQRLKTEITDREKQEREIHDLAMDEATGKKRDKTTGRVGKGLVYEQRMAAYKRFAGETNILRTKNDDKIAKNQQRIDELAATQDDRVRDTTAVQMNSDGLLARLKGLSDISSQFQIINLASWFLIILFIMLETAPVLVKLFSNRGPYDDIYDGLEHKVFVRERKMISQLNDDINTEVALSRQMNAGKLAAELQLSASTMESMQTILSDEICEAQMEIGKLLIEQWKRREMQRLGLRNVDIPIPRNGGAAPPRHNADAENPEFVRVNS